MDVHSHEPVELAKAYWAEVQIVQLVFHTLAVTPSHQAIVPSAVLEAEHVPNLVNQRLHGTMKQLRTESCRIPSSLRHVADETEHRYSLGQTREAVHEIPFRLGVQVTHRHGHHSVRIARDSQRHDGIQHFVGMELLTEVAAAACGPRTQAGHRSRRHHLHEHRSEEADSGSQQNLVRSGLFGPDLVKSKKSWSGVLSNIASSHS